MKEKENLAIDLMTVINPLRCLDTRFSGDIGRQIEIIREYLEYNVTGFDDYKMFYQNMEVRNTSISVPVYSYQDINEDSPYAFVVFGTPGEIHYSFKYETTVEDCLENNLNLISFGMKTGEALYFMKNYITDKVFVREEYRPDKEVIKAKLYYFHIYDNDFSSNRSEYWKNQDTTMMNSNSAFAYPCFCREWYNEGKIIVRKIEDGLYKIDIRDVDGRPVDDEIRKGESVYSVYYDYMVEKGYFKSSNEKIKGM